MIDLISQKHRPLGKLPPRKDARTFKLASYLKGAVGSGSGSGSGAATPLPKPPSACDWGKKTNGKWPMYLNDQIGDCTAASAAHMLEAWSASSGRPEVEVSDDDVLAMYRATGHYVPNRPETDGGAVMLDVLNYWRNVGLGRRKGGARNESDRRSDILSSATGSYRIGAYVAVPAKNAMLVKTAMYLFGGLYAGFALPLSAQNQAVWDLSRPGFFGDYDRNSWGGHAVSISQYGRKGLTCVTWGGLQPMTWRFLAAYCDELYAIISPDFFNHHGLSPAGFDMARLREDLNHVTG